MLGRVRAGVGELVPYGGDRVLVVVHRALGAAGRARVAGERGRGLHQHQPLHPVGVLLGHQPGDDAAHAVADEPDPVQLQFVEEAHDVLGHQLQVVVVGPVALAVAAQVQGVDPPLLAEQGPGRLPVRGRTAEAVQQHDGRAERVAPGAVREAHIADIHNRLIFHALTLQPTGGGPRHRPRPGRAPARRDRAGSHRAAVGGVGQWTPTPAAAGTTCSPFAGSSSAASGLRPT